MFVGFLGSVLWAYNDLQDTDIKHEARIQVLEGARVETKETLDKIEDVVNTVKTDVEVIRVQVVPRANPINE